jgi:methylated-DNA-[protein]-cysteine S-methyltransferase
MLYTIISSPLGDITAAIDNDALAELHIAGDRYFTKVPADWLRADHVLFEQLSMQLEEYFAGKRTSFDLPIDLNGTEFQRLVWQKLQAIPQGTTTTYARIAEEIGKPKAVRAVGTAIGKNPLCIVVPCHRVLASNGSLGGYVAGLDRKQQLLTLEGAM